MSDDLDTHQALQIWVDQASTLNQEQFEYLFNIFGLKFVSIDDNPKVQKLANERVEARAKKDFLTADNRRDEIERLGYEVLDTNTETKYIPR